MPSCSEKGHLCIQKGCPSVEKGILPKARTTRDSFAYLNSCKTLTKRFFSSNHGFYVLTLRWCCGVFMGAWAARRLKTHKKVLS
jgi:hypothetical protein